MAWGCWVQGGYVHHATHVFLADFFPIVQDYCGIDQPIKLTSKQNNKKININAIQCSETEQKRALPYIIIKK
jgi:hypothetical protein